MNIPMQKIGMSDLKVEFISVSVEVKNRAHAPEMVKYLRKLSSEDPAIKIIYNPGVEARVTIRVTSVPGLRPLHTEDIISRLEADCKIEVTPKNPDRKAETTTVTKIMGATFLFCNHLVPVARKTVERDGYDATILAFGKGKIKSWNKAQHTLFEGLGYAPHSICESRHIACINEADLNQEIDLCNLFRVGCKVDVAGTTLGRGFAGVMKRHNFSGLPASHGVTLKHRSGGSTGQRTYAGRVFKGKKMAGHYGNERVTIQSLQVLMSSKMNIGGTDGAVIAVLGSIPGYDSGMCFVKPAAKGGK
jgi:large subunit ribosomal protein L3